MRLLIKKTAFSFLNMTKLRKDFRYWNRITARLTQERQSGQIQADICYKRLGQAHCCVLGQARLGS